MKVFPFYYRDVCCIHYRACIHVQHRKKEKEEKKVIYRSTDTQIYIAELVFLAPNPRSPPPPCDHLVRYVCFANGETVFRIYTHTHGALELVHKSFFFLFFQV